MAEPLDSSVNDSNATVDYRDHSDATVEYKDEELEGPQSFTGTSRVSAFDGNFQQGNVFSFLFTHHKDSNPYYADTVSEHQQAHNMLVSLLPEFRAMWNSVSPHEGFAEYLVDVNTLEILRVDDDTANLTEQELIDFSETVHIADFKELHQFVEHSVFEGMKRSDLPANSNIVDCVWVRKWKQRPTIVKSRMCARGCFDRQKHLIDRHSSTASRLSQRLVLSLGMVEGLIWGDDIDTESLDISCAFLQGLRYEDLERLSRQLGFEQKALRSVCVVPPENAWSHFRRMSDAPEYLKVPDASREHWCLKALKATYGFSDAPLMFQLALLQYLEEECGAHKSLFDSNFLYWVEYVDDKWQLTLLLTAHVDDLQVTGCLAKRTWLHGMLEKRFGPLKRQRMPYTHTGIELERLPSGTLRLHQDHFCSKLVLANIDKSRKEDEFLTGADVTTFRSLTCGALWACQTNCHELSCITSLQQKLSKPQVKDLINANQAIKRLRSSHRERFGIYFRLLTPPLRVVCVSDASAANKQSDYATEGVCVLLAEDHAHPLQVDKHDFVVDGTSGVHGGHMHLLICTSTKSKRISHSTSHAETHACARAIPNAQLVSMRICEPDLMSYVWPDRLTPMALLHITDSLRPWLATDAYVDCMDLFDLATGQKGVPVDKSQRLGILAIREERRSGRLRRFGHLTTHYMLMC